MIYHLMKCSLGNLGPFRNLAFPKRKARGLTVSDTLGLLGERNSFTNLSAHTLLFLF